VGRNTGAFFEVVEADELADDVVEADVDWLKPVENNNRDTAISRSADFMFLISP